MRRAVIVGATSGIGQACAERLAATGEWSVIAVGRDQPGRSEAVVQSLNEQNLSKADEQKHQFRTVDAFSLVNVRECARKIAEEHGSIDALIMTHSMATIQGFTPTAEGNDQKLTLHYWSRMAFSSMLLPSLRNSSQKHMPGGPVVLSVLSGGVHSAYKAYETDFEMKKNYSIKNAADAAGFYNDLGFDAMARRPGNERVAFVHSSPGFVRTTWGSEIPFYLKPIIRFLQRFAKPASEAAEHMLTPILDSASGKSMLDRPSGQSVGIFIMDQSGKPDKLTSQHSEQARDFVWSKTAELLKRSAGIDIDK